MKPTQSQPPTNGARTRSPLRRLVSQCAASVRRGVGNLQYAVNRHALRNPASRRMYRSHKGDLSAAESAVVEQLSQHGFAIVPLEGLVRPTTKPLADRMVEAAKAFGEGETVQAAIAKFASGDSRGVAKEYVVKKYEPMASRDATDPIFEFGLSPEILNIVNAYAGLWVKYYDSNVLFNIPQGVQRDRVQSQNWHRDFEDEPTIKVFLYLREVDDAAGPLEYIPGSRRGGPYANLWPMPGYGRKIGWYPPLEVIDRAVPSSERVKCCVPAGTLVFCDTSGFHRGGFASEKPRLACVWSYLTPASLAPRLFTVNGKNGEDQQSAAARFAMS